LNVSCARLESIRKLTQAQMLIVLVCDRRDGCCSCICCPFLSGSCSAHTSTIVLAGASGFLATVLINFTLDRLLMLRRVLLCSRLCSGLEYASRQ
jgi:hypothetical protein